jgi:spermidine synthase
LPLVVKSSLVRGGALAEQVGLLYGANTAGAVAGALIAGTHLVGLFGIRSSFLIAAAVNVTVAGAAFLIGRGQPDAQAVGRVPETETLSGEDGGPGDAPAGVRHAVLAVFGLSGFASLALEVIWFRILVVYTGVTVYAFISMLSTFLAGIAVGSWVVTPLMRRDRPWLSVLVLLQAAIGIVTISSLALVEWLFGQSWMRTSHVTTLAIAPATLLMGAAFPIGLRLWAGRDSRIVARRVGVFYAVNVCAAVAGSAAAGFLLLPRLGARLSLIVVAGMFVGSAWLLLVQARQQGQSGQAGRAGRAGRTGAIRWATGAALTAVFLGTTFVLPDPFAVALSRHPGPILWREEGVQTTVSVHYRTGGGLVMYLDGLHQASDTPDVLLTHRRIGLLPLLLHPRPGNALVVGLGGGATAGAVARDDDVSVEVVELSEAVVRGAGWFRQINHGVLDAPNVRLRIDDGRNFLLLNRQRYDVITADLIQPGHAGAGSLYSVEYFRLARAALAEGGVMLQWIGDREVTPYKLIMRTVLEAFPHATLWANGSLMVGTREPLRLDRASLERRLADPAIQADLAEIGIDGYDALLNLYTAGPREMRAFVGTGDILTDDHPLVEYYLALPRGEPMVDLSRVRGDVRRHLTTPP